MNMNSKKKQNMSLSLELDVQEKLKLVAKTRTDGNVSKLIRELSEKYLFIEENVIPVVLKIPVELKGNREALEEWMNTKILAIVNTLSK